MVEILFVNATKEVSINKEVNGTLLLGTRLLQADFDVKVLRFGEIEGYHQDYHTFIDRITARILEMDPKCVSFYSLWPYFHIVVRIAINLKQARPDIIVVMGGPQPSATAPHIMEAMPFVDYVCTGEGEDTVVPFFDSILRKDCEGLDQIPGLYYRKDGVVTYTNIEVPLCDLNALPQWDDRLYMYRYTEPEPNLSSENYFFNLDVGRGCPYNCSFCSCSYFWKRTYRLKTPERIVEDIRYHYDKFGIRSFGFSHDAFTTNAKLVNQVCDQFIEQKLNITWNCSARIDCIDEALILKMKEAGLTQIELGIEVGSKRMQKLTHKNLNLERAKKMVDFVMAQGIRIGLFFMCGFPEETMEDLTATLDLMYELVDKGINHVGMSYLRFNPNTELAEKYFDQLYYDPTIKFMGRGIYGFDEELEMIKANKAIFPFYYHLETPLRREVQYMTLLVTIYEKLPNSIKYLRRLYNGDNMQFYRDFIACNKELFDGTITEICRKTNFYPLELLFNMLDQFDVPYKTQLKGLMQYDWDFEQIRHKEPGTVMQNLYSFDYSDLLEKLPIEEYSQRSSFIRMTKTEEGVSKQGFKVN